MSKQPPVPKPSSSQTQSGKPARSTRVPAASANDLLQLQKMYGSQKTARFLQGVLQQRAIQRMDSGRSVRSSTRSQTLGVSHDLNTRRARQTREMGHQRKRNLQRQPYKEDENGNKLWNGVSRPAWPTGFEDDWWGDQPSHVDANTGITTYLCKTGTNDWGLLPRARDADKGEDTASIGHKKQWRDYILDNLDPDVFRVAPNVYILAYDMKKVLDLYTDDDNLEPQGQSYNSSRAKKYNSDPLSQTYATEDDYESPEEEDEEMM